MKLQSLHNHTSFCDGKGTVEDFCKAALQRKFTSIGFSAHDPLPEPGFDNSGHLSPSRLNEYINAVRQAGVKYAGRLQVFLGLEADYIEGRLAPGRFNIEKLGLDYLIGSVHLIIKPDDKLPDSVDASPASFEELITRHFGSDIDALVDIYWDNEEHLIEAGGFDILGHVDLIRKNNPNDKYFSTVDKKWNAHLDSVADKIIKSGVVVEVNTGGLARGRTADCYPSVNLLRRLKTANVPVMINGDAHACEFLDGKYDAAQRQLLDAGYKSIVYFNGRKNGAPVWEDMGI